MVPGKRSTMRAVRFHTGAGATAATRSVRSRHPQADRLLENLGAADVRLSASEVAEIDAALDAMEMSDVYGGTTVKK